MPSASPVIDGELVRPMMVSALSSRAASAARILPTPSSSEITARLLLAECARQHRVLDHQRGNAGGFQFLHRAHHVQRVAVAVVGIDHQRQLAGAVDAIGLGGEFRQRQHDQVGRAQHRERGDGPGEHADLEAEVLGDAGGDRIMDRARMDAVVAGDGGAVALAAIGPVHGFPRFDFAAS